MGAYPFAAVSGEERKQAMRLSGSVRRRVLACCWLMGASLGTAAAQEIVPPDRPISIQEAIEIAIQNRGNVAAGEENVAIARQRVRQARTGTLPNIQGVVSFSSRASSDLLGIFGSSATLRGGSV